MANKKNLSSSQALSKEEKSAKEFIGLSIGNKCDVDWKKDAKRLLDEYKGKYFKSPSRRTRFTVNTIFSLVNLLMPNLFFNQPYIRVSPKNARYQKKQADGSILSRDAISAGQVREAALNHKYTQIGAFKEQSKAIFDSFFYPFGVIKTGYSYETVTEFDKEFTVKDSPFLKRLCPLDFGYHPLANGIDDSIKLAHRSLTTKTQLAKAGKYDKALIDELKGEIPSHLKDKLNDKQLENEKDYVTLYEVHDQEADMVYLYGGEEKLLLDKHSRSYDYSGSDFSIIKLAGDNDSFEGIPLLLMVEDEAIALNEIMTLIIEHFRKFPAMIFADEGSLSLDQVERIHNGEQGSIHLVNDVSKLKPVNPLAMGGEYFQIVTLLQGIIDRVLGVQDFQSMGGSSRKSATEASFIQGDATVRREYYLSIVKDFTLEGIRKIAALQAQFQNEKEEIQASGDLKGISFTYDKEDIQGDFLFDFDIDSLKASNEAQMNNIINLLNVVSTSPVLQPISRSFDPLKVGKDLFKKAGSNIEAYQYGSIETTLYPTPEMEDEQARKGKPMPPPKDGEDIEYHLKVHGQDLLEKGPNSQILEHIAETMMLKQQQAGPPQVQATPPAPPPGAQPPNSPMVSQPEAVQPAGPQGPMQQG